MFNFPKLDDIFDGDLPVSLSRVPNGILAPLLGQLASQYNNIAWISNDGQETANLLKGLEAFAPFVEVVEFPAWDCLPYDRVSPSNHVIARRISALGRIIDARNHTKPIIVITTANAVLQKLVPLDSIEGQVFKLAPGQRINLDQIIHWFSANGFERSPTVRQRGEFAVRGGIVDLYAPSSKNPVRLDFFGDELESIREFDAESQRTTKQLKSLRLAPMSEIVLNEQAISAFRTAYISKFGAATREDALYQAISEGRRFHGMEHWMPLFYDEMATYFDYLQDFHFVVDERVADSLTSAHEQILDHYEARKSQLDQKFDGGAPYKPIEPDALYLSAETVIATLESRQAAKICSFEVPESSKSRVISMGGKQGRSFAVERASGQNVFEALVNHAAEERKRGQKVVISCWSEGSRDRLSNVLEEHSMGSLVLADGAGQLETLKQGQTALLVLPLEEGFEAGGYTFVAEQDLLGDRLVRKSRKKKGADFISEVSSLAQGDIVVHVDHGIGRFVGLKTIEAMGAPHDCLELHYSGEDKLFLPVENIELLSRYGSSDTQVMLDKLGGVAWQSRKAKLKKRLLDMADQLIKIAAERALKTADRLLLPQGLYDEFAARFPYDETEDQQSSIHSVLEDLGSGMPMDRLVCGDVGFGKTEVALRAAFVASMAGKQVAVVVPTTLLARQHFKTFSDRFKGLPVNVRHASRLVSTKELSETKKGIADGTVDIVVGTHALLGNSINFDRLGLLVIDEEQRFGVKHKERLKELKSDVHVLTLSATPIPRTLQLALTGVRELSLITTAPVDRMAVRTFISPFDALVVREALLRERYRGGQSFYVCPRVSDLEERQRFLAEQVPELKVAIAHGQMAPGELDDVMNAFYDGKYDVLLSTTIVESGLDIPTANTLIVHRADMFGLAQLYQIRGRVGRSKTRAYALFTLPVNKTLTAMAERRLRVLQSLDSIGAGFELASHDLDIRGSGNLLGEEQSGQIREVGYELYQQMLEEAVAELKDQEGFDGSGRWSPQIAIGTPVLIPETYVSDLQLRLNLYRRLSSLNDAAEIDEFGAEMIDRFGPLPEEVDHLLKVVFIKGLCFTANIEKIDAGPKGVVIQFRDNNFKNPAELVKWIGEQGSQAKIRPDQKIVLMRDWDTGEKRLKGTAVIVSKLAQFANKAPA